MNQQEAVKLREQVEKQLTENNPASDYMMALQHSGLTRRQAFAALRKAARCEKGAQGLLKTALTAYRK